MSAKCQVCGAEWPEDFLVEAELLDGEANEVVTKCVCPSCLGEFEQNDLELIETKVFEPRHLISPYILSSNSSSFHSSM